jgi:copper chaperone CopZ
MSQLRLRIGTMNCRHCVREVSGWLRDVPGVVTVVADARSGTVELAGTMRTSEVLAVFVGSTYTPQVLDDTATATAP